MLESGKFESEFWGPYKNGKSYIFGSLSLKRVTKLKLKLHNLEHGLSKPLQWSPV